MTEKRFRYTDNGFVIDYQSEQKVLNLCDVVELLNMLHEENQELRKKNAKRKRKNKHHRTVIEELGAVIMGYKGVIKELKEENEQLKQQLTDCEKLRHYIFKKMDELRDDSV